MSLEEFEAMSPLELAWRFWGERRRRHRNLRYLTWAVSNLMAIHLKQSDQHKVSPQNLFLQATGGDVDEDEV